MKRSGFRVSPKNALKRTTAPHRPRSKGDKSMAKLKKELDRLFSIYIRKKYPEYCYTCGKRGVLQNGHFVPRQYLATRWEEKNCRPQCIGCNIFGNGQILEFEERLKKELGDVVVEQLKASRHQIIKLDRIWYETQIKLYTP